MKKILQGMSVASMSIALIVTNLNASASDVPTEAFIWDEINGIIGLGDLPGGISSSIVYGTSADGSIAVGNSRTALGEEAFIWDEINGMRNFRSVLVNEYGLDLTGWILTNGVATSADAQTIVGTGLNPLGSVEGWVVNIIGSQANFEGIGPLPGGNFGSYVGGISDDGQFIVGGSGLEGDEAFRWNQQTGMLGLGDLPGGSFRSHAEGASSDGAVIVGQSDSEQGLQAYRWTEETGMVGLGFLSGGSFSGASAVSDNGSVIVGVSENNNGEMEAYRWTEETGMVGLGFLSGGSASEAFALSADGSIIVGQSESNFGVEAFLWTEENGMISLGGLSTCRVDVACAISADGLTVFGGAVSDSSIVCTPEPSQIIGLLGLGIIGTASTLKRKKKELEKVS